MKTSSNVVLEMTMTLTLKESRTLRKILAQVSQGVSPLLNDDDVIILRAFNQEVGTFVDKCKDASS